MTTIRIVALAGSEAFDAAGRLVAAAAFAQVNAPVQALLATAPRIVHLQ